VRWQPPADGIEGLLASLIPGAPLASIRRSGDRPPTAQM